MKPVNNLKNYSNHPASSVSQFHKNQNLARSSSLNSQESSNELSVAENSECKVIGRLPFKIKLKELQALYLSQESKKYPKAVVKAFLKAMAMISAANCEQDIYNFKSLKFHRLNRNCKQEYALSLTGNWRLITKFEETEGIKYLLILKIEDYH
ncbi:type II toxin-antitoxin system RelE/ParE family toxin [Anabaena sp. CCY 9402-a]|uniref:type II toxin-antitoxin system RelE/ParE family toxin n=1 Tax=Anabaena sp. CCY 9402-a TaxID=3103867 RepID=UPI0039C65727